MPIVDIFDAGRLAQLRLAQACGQPPVFPLGEFTVDEKPQALLEGQGRHVRHLALLDKGLIHAREAEGLEFVEGRMREH
jgi:hypothetical protein